MMASKLDDNDLKKVSGGTIDKTKKYTFYMNQSFKSKTDSYVSISIIGNYINVPYNTEINVFYFDHANNRSSKEHIPAYYIDENYY